MAKLPTKLQCEHALAGIFPLYAHQLTTHTHTPSLNFPSLLCLFLCLDKSETTANTHTHTFSAGCHPICKDHVIVSCHLCAQCTVSRICVVNLLTNGSIKSRPQSRASSVAAQKQPQNKRCTWHCHSSPLFLATCQFVSVGKQPSASLPARWRANKACLICGFEGKVMRTALN